MASAARAQLKEGQKINKYIDPIIANKSEVLVGVAFLREGLTSSALKNAREQARPK